MWGIFEDAYGYDPKLSFEDFTYEKCKQVIIVEIRNRIADGKITDNEIEEIVESREHTFWFEEYKNLYNAMLYASKLILAIKSGDFSIESFDGGVESFTKQWHRVDMWYRKAVFYLGTPLKTLILKNIL